MAKGPPVEGVAERPRCPGCRVELRMRDDKGADPQFPCPECHVPLRRDRDEVGRTIIVLAEIPASEKVAPARKSARRRTAMPPPSKNEVPDRTLLFFGIGMVAVAALVIGWLAWGRSGTPVEIHPQPIVNPANPATIDPPPPVADVNPLDQRLAGLAEQIRAHTAEQGQFPTATDANSSLPIAQQLSWLARLEVRSATLPTERRPVLDQPWHDPVNEPFVGRSIPGYLNPFINTLVGDDGRPATHFVGVAGVGRDAVDLPSGHPRAGMFGTKHTVTVQDLRDGQANVVMVLGVETQLGSWADPGRATVRPLTSPPYLHGPDGFGGGIDKPLPALMADGSVRHFTAETDPLLLRRLAAIADGFPLDITVPGEPGDAPPSSAPVGPSVAENDPDNPPVSAVAAIAEAQRPAVVRPPVVPLLQQRLTSFEQTKPASRRELLTIAEDLLGRPVVFDRDDLGPLAQQLDVKVTFHLEDTTIAAVLEQILSGSDLALVIGPETAAVRRRIEGTPSAIRLEP